jgi:hypothetical protein
LAKRGVKNIRFGIRTAFPDCLGPDLFDGALDVVFHPPTNLQWYQRRKPPTSNVLAVVGGYHDRDVRISLLINPMKTSQRLQRLQHANLISTLVFLITISSGGGGEPAKFVNVNTGDLSTYFLYD